MEEKEEEMAKLKDILKQAESKYDEPTNCLVSLHVEARSCTYVDKKAMIHIKH